MSLKKFMEFGMYSFYPGLRHLRVNRKVFPSTIFHRFLSSELNSFREYEVNIKTCGDLYRRWRKERKFKSLPNGDLNFKVTYIDNYKNCDIKSKSSIPVIVGIHGAPGSYNDFYGLASYLQDKARIIVPNLPDFSFYKPGVFRFSTEEKAQFLKDFLAEISVSRIDALVLHSSGIYPALRLCFDDSLTIKSLIMLNVATHNFDMKCTRHIKQMRKIVVACENPLLLKILQPLAPYLLKIAKIPIRIENVMDTLLSATTMVYADIPQAKESFIHLSLKGTPILYAFSNDDKVIGKKASYDLTNLLGASNDDIYIYDKDGILIHKGRECSALKVMSFEEGSHYVFKKHADIIHKAVEDFLDKL
ncbi:uncharacterized protein NPIL_533951 [Nephila pilipes]|uniref:Uncharacterized protein n=1 Tax=Nephila pilipes TaxID=299642 RepID=A0A8X6P8D2_NEPPI|nr:uncharacterized protein NPIL_533951 [Nephila pilipes]